MIVDVHTPADIPTAVAEGTLLYPAGRVVSSTNKECADLKIVRPIVHAQLPMACACGIQAKFGVSRGKCKPGHRYLYVTCGKNMGRPANAPDKNACAFFCRWLDAEDVVYPPGGGMPYAGDGAPVTRKRPAAELRPASVERCVHPKPATARLSPDAMSVASAENSLTRASAGSESFAREAEAIQLEGRVAGLEASVARLERMLQRFVDLQMRIHRQ